MNMRWLRLARWIALSSLLVFLCPQISQAGILTGLVAYYPFDGNANDASGHGYDLALAGNAGFASGQFGQALSLDGTGNQYASRPISDAAFNFGSGDFTIQGWADFATVGAPEILIEKFTGGSGPGWTLYALSGGIEFYNGGPVTASQALATNQWYQFAVEQSGGTLSLFVNGSLLASGTVGTTISTDPLLIGRRNAGDGRACGLNGQIDDVAIWNRALSQDEISYLSLHPLSSANSVPEPGTVFLLGLGILLLCRKRLA